MKLDISSQLGVVLEKSVCAKTYKIKHICSMEGPACSKEGIRHDQSLCMDWVPKDIPAAVSAPTKYRALKREVMTGRSLG